MKKILIILIIGLALALAAFSCKDPDPPNHSTITAFGKTITVKGDASISTANFNTAKGKLQTAMTGLDEGITPGAQRDKFITMVNRTGFAILIKTGNASPDADANKSMTIGVDYLLNNDAEQTIAGAIRNKVNTDNAFAD
jgi:ABC-type oligopeptide transport system substrate-binding subunit